MSLKVLVFFVFHGFAMFSLDEIAGTDPVKKQQKKEEYSLSCFRSPKQVVEYLNKLQGERMRAICNFSENSLEALSEEIN